MLADGTTREQVVVSRDDEVSTRWLLFRRKLPDLEDLAGEVLAGARLGEEPGRPMVAPADGRAVGALLPLLPDQDSLRPAVPAPRLLRGQRRPHRFLRGRDRAERADPRRARAAGASGGRGHGLDRRRRPRESRRPARRGPGSRGRAGAEVPRLHAGPTRRGRLGAARGRLAGRRRSGSRQRSSPTRTPTSSRSFAPRSPPPTFASTTGLGVPASGIGASGNRFLVSRQPDDSQSLWETIERALSSRVPAGHGRPETRRSASSPCSSCSPRCGSRTETRRRLCSTSFGATMRASSSRSRPGAPAYGWCRCRTRPRVSPDSGAAASWRAPRSAPQRRATRSCRRRLWTSTSSPTGCSRPSARSTTRRPSGSGRSPSATSSTGSSAPRSERTREARSRGSSGAC